MTATAHRTCPRCHSPLSPDDAFCEGCGEAVPDEHRREVDHGVVAAVSDRGRVRTENQDAVRVAAAGDVIFAIVCDGVASSDHGGEAAEAAAAAARDNLIGIMDGRAWRPEDATRRAMAAAQEAVGTLGLSTGLSRRAPACTYVSAVWDGKTVTVGSVGDSRAYWVEPDRCRLLTIDHSLAEDHVRAGRLSPGQAVSLPNAHAITRWLGSDAPDEPWPVETLVPEGPGRLVVCSDGLWNYVRGERELGLLVRSFAGPPIELARALTATAVAAGGNDNVTVAVIDVATDGRRPRETVT